MIAVALLAAHVSLCGVRFDVPPKWTAERERDQEDENVRCHVSIRPPDFEKKAEQSIFGVSDPPLSLETFASEDDALAGTDFYRDDDGQMWAVGRSDVKAGRYRVNRWSGWTAETWYRGYVKDDARSRLAEGESGVYSTSGYVFVLKSRDRVIGVRCQNGPDDVHVDCKRVTDSLLRSLR